MKTDRVTREKNTDKYWEENVPQNWMLVFFVEKIVIFLSISNGCKMDRSVRLLRYAYTNAMALEK